MNQSLTVADLSRLLQLILDIADKERCTPAEAIHRMALLCKPASGTTDRAAIAAYADRVRRMRLRRNELFGAPLFRDPAWDMLLELYVAQHVGREVSVSSLCYASGVPPSTALRQVMRLEEHGLIERQNDDKDNRRIFVNATPKALAAVETAVTMLLRHEPIGQSPANDDPVAEPDDRSEPTDEAVPLTPARTKRLG